MESSTLRTRVEAGELGAPPSDEERTAAVEAALGLADAEGAPRWPLRLAALLLLAALAAAAVLATRDRDGAGVQWIKAPIEVGDLIKTVTATGTVEPTNEVEVGSELSGIVRAVHVDFNDRVRKGQVLAVLDTTKLETSVAVSSATLASKRARLLEAEATLEETARDLVRARRLSRSGARSDQELDAALAAHARAEAQRASASAEIEVARSDLAMVQADLAKAQILSPIDGVVLERDVDPGQTVAASLQAPVLFLLAEDLRHMELQIDVDEADVGVTRVGQRATFSVDAYPKRTFPAQLRQLRFAPEASEGVVSYKAILSLDNADLLLRPGMTATATLTVEEVKGALLVPNTALRFQPPVAEEGDQRSLLESILPGPPRFGRKRQERSEVPQVWVLREGLPRAVEVEVGASDGTRTVIHGAGLAAGVEVLVDYREAR